MIDSDNDGVSDDLDQCQGYDDSIDVDGDGIADAVTQNVAIVKKHLLVYRILKIHGLSWMTMLFLP